MTTTYLVTGGAGFIGSNFVLGLLQNRKRDIRVVNLDKLTYAGNLANLGALEGDERHIFVQADICDREVVAALFERWQPRYVVNFAAESHVDRSIEDPDVFVRTNVGGTVTLLQAAKQAWEQPAEPLGYRPGVRFLQVSTDEVYGSLGAEGFFTEDTPLDPHSPYSASKAAADLLAQAFFDTYRLPVNITRCSNNYGPFQFPEKLIPLMLNNALQHQPLPVYGDGLQVRDWLYVEDHCRAIELVLEHGVAGEVYNIGGHNERTNLQIVQAILAYVAKNVDKVVDDGLITHVTDRKGHDRRYGIDPRKIGEALGWQPQTAFEQGIVRTLDWYLAHQDWLADVTSGAYLSYYQKIYGDR
ncbi:MAG: dTDP-glucose 4,6-dehydratase [Coriobacteriales bacterium]|jgi:dTDP-glucose 4,6-dehydratase|nr:dTDP-glucose 4,6-dehydratase [Coriobacteriales bacterium]